MFMARLLLMLACTFALSACRLGFEFDDSSSESGDIYSGPSDNASWRLNLDNNGFGFTLTKRPRIGGNISYQVRGTFETLDTGLLQLSITTSPLPNEIPGAEIIALQLDDNAIMIYPFENGENEFIALVPGDECPSADLRGNAIFYDKAEDASSDEQSFFGLFRYSINSTQLRLQDGIALTDDYTRQNEESIDSDECSNGTVELDAGDHYLNTEGSVVELDNNPYGRVLSLPAGNVSTLSDMDGSYAGFARKYSTTEEVSYASAECSDGVCNVFFERDPSNFVQTNNPYRFDFDDDSAIPEQGFLTGTLTRNENGGIQANLLCTAHTDLDSSSATLKLLACLGQSPLDITRTVNFFLTSTDN